MREIKRVPLTHKPVPQAPSRPGAVPTDSARPGAGFGAGQPAPDEPGGTGSAGPAAPLLSSGEVIDLTHLDTGAGRHDGSAFRFDEGSPRVRVRDRDRELVKFLLRYRFATAHQISKYLGVSYHSFARRRVQLREAGLINSVEGGPSRYEVWFATENGESITHMDPPVSAPRQLSWATLRHSLALTSLGIHYEMRGEDVSTEAEYSARESGNWQSRNRVIIPDLVLQRGRGKNVGIEVELTSKNRRALATVLYAYARSDVAAVHYVTTQPRIVQQVNGFAERFSKDIEISAELWQFPPEMGVTTNYGLLSKDEPAPEV